MNKPPTAPHVCRPQLNAAQAKAASNARQNSNAPVAPPVYRPQPLPKVLQRKIVGGQQPNRPQPILKTLQRKTVDNPPQGRGVLQQSKSPVSPQPYRPQPVAKVLQARAPVAASMKRPPVRSSNSVQRQRAASLPQRNSPVPARQKVIQPYTAINTPLFQGKRSEHGVYVTGQDLPEIYVLAGHTVERSTRTVRTKNIDGVDYEVWEPEFVVIGDCVASMEELMHGKKLLYGSPRISEYRDVTPSGKKAGKKSGKKRKAFGEDDDQNRKFGKVAHVDKDADPGLLEGFVIARQGFKMKKSCPQFHGAAVVAKDGDDNITLETSAPPSGGISRSRVTPVYDMYNHGKDKDSQSFKAMYQAEYGVDATVSVVKPVSKLPKKALAKPKALKVVDYKP